MLQQRPSSLNLRENANCGLRHKIQIFQKEIETFTYSKQLENKSLHKHSKQSSILRFQNNSRQSLRIPKVSVRLLL